MAAFLKQLRQTRLHEFAGTYLELQHMKCCNAYMIATPEIPHRLSFLYSHELQWINNKLKKY